MDLTRDALEASGFVGFETWRELTWYGIPRRPGVYVVVRQSLDPPEFLGRSRAGRHKGRDPTVSPARLEAAWVERCPVLYIGKASRLRTRLRQYRAHGEGKPVGHWGGRYIWQLQDSSNLLVAWKETDDEPRHLEQQMLSTFLQHYGQLPFANLKR